MNNTFVFDTYALIEIINENKNYIPYLEKNMIINDFIYAELCFVLTRNNYQKIKEHLDKCKKFIVHVKPEVILSAMEFRVKNLKKNVSITDCISYIMAKELGIKFLTGDKEFENMNDVEFVKK